MRIDVTDYHMSVNAELLRILAPQFDEELERKCSVHRQHHERAPNLICKEKQ